MTLDLTDVFQMIKVFSIEKKGEFTIVAKADHQRDLNNLRLMSYRFFSGKDKINLNKDEFGGPYLKIPCEQFKRADGSFDQVQLERYMRELEHSFS